MKANDILKQQFLEVVENQLRDNEPPETLLTLKRLMEQGYTRQEARDLIAAAVAAEVFQVMKNNEAFNRARFVANLDRLPELPE